MLTSIPLQAPGGASLPAAGSLPATYARLRSLATGLSASSPDSDLLGVPGFVSMQIAATDEEIADGAYAPYDLFAQGGSIGDLLSLAVDPTRIQASFDADGRLVLSSLAGVIAVRVGSPFAFERVFERVEFDTAIRDMPAADFDTTADRVVLTPAQAAAHALPSSYAGTLGATLLAARREIVAGGDDLSPGRLLTLARGQDPGLVILEEVGAQLGQQVEYYLPNDAGVERVTVENLGQRVVSLLEGLPSLSVIGFSGLVDAFGSPAIRVSPRTIVGGADQGRIYVPWLSRYVDLVAGKGRVAASGVSVVVSGNAESATLPLQEFVVRLLRHIAAQDARIAALEGAV